MTTAYNTWFINIMFAEDFPAYLDIPDVSAAAFIAPTATVLGRVSLGAGSSIWYGAVVRGDVERIDIGSETNVQDGAVIHGDPGTPTILENWVTVGHRAVIHGAHIETGSLIGMGAIVLDGVRVGAGSIIGAGSVITKTIPPRSLVLGMPGRVIREITDIEAHDLLHHAQRYARLAQAHAQNCQVGRDVKYPSLGAYNKPIS
jgi:carbonic anhydrase/acetyltransferase-like protein (isoleucine patch superfamily)